MKEWDENIWYQMRLLATALPAVFGSKKMNGWTQPLSIVASNNKLFKTAQMENRWNEKMDKFPSNLVKSHAINVRTVPFIPFLQIGQFLRAGAHFMQETRCPQGNKTIETSSSIQIWKIKSCCILVWLHCHDKPTNNCLTLVEARDGSNDSNLKKDSHFAHALAHGLA